MVVGVCLLLLLAGQAQLSQRVGQVTKLLRMKCCCCRQRSVQQVMMVVTMQLLLLEVLRMILRLPMLCRCAGGVSVKADWRYDHLLVANVAKTAIVVVVAKI